QEGGVKEGRKRRRIMYLTIGFDHRIVDGADGAKFLERVSSILSEFDPMTGI
ncbi:MAG: 2-oxo acid dehydrogenase subunit E2, partial [Candidatus Marinimicrobia bacterium]|nr:2-oxo acid dehydrogenase subunit E2 [Candidatus Neomarinimicrobiota bacterium]